MLNLLVELFDSAMPRSIKSLAKRAFPGIDQSVYRVVKRFTKDKQQAIRIRRGPLAKRLFCCSLKYERNYWLGVYEPELTAWIAGTVQPGDVFYDVGVHKGYFSLLAASRVGSKGRVIGFEPNPTNLAAAQENLKLNPDLAAVIQLEALAVSDKSGTARFQGKAHSTVGHLVQSGHANRASDFEVTVTSLDEFVATGAPPPNVVKMDIEGGEQWALPGMVGVLMNSRPRLLVEIHDRPSADKLFEVAGKCQYTIETLDRTSVPSADHFRERTLYVAIPKA